jgi:hypothetical protein
VIALPHAWRSCLCSGLLRVTGKRVAVAGRSDAAGLYIFGRIWTSPDSDGFGKLWSRLDAPLAGPLFLSNLEA